MKHATTIHDNTAAFPAAARAHLREVAAESGVDHCEYRSCEKAITLADGRACEVWYDEGSGSPFAWRAFVAGVGTRSGASREEAIKAFDCFRVHVGYTPRGRDRWQTFPDLASANAFCEDVRKASGTILSVTPIPA